MAYFVDKCFYCLKNILQTLLYSHLYLRTIFFFNINNCLFFPVIVKYVTDMGVYVVDFCFTALFLYLLLDIFQGL